MSIGEGLSNKKEGNNNNNNNNDDDENTIKSLKSVLTVFTAALVGAAIATIAGNNIGREGQAGLAAFMQLALNFANKANVGKGTGFLSKGLKSLQNLFAQKIIVSAISQGLSRGFANNIRRSYEKNSYR